MGLRWSWLFSDVVIGQPVRNGRWIVGRHIFYRCLDCEVEVDMGDKDDTGGGACGCYNILFDSLYQLAWVKRPDRVVVYKKNTFLGIL